MQPRLVATWAVVLALAFGALVAAFALWASERSGADERRAAIAVQAVAATANAVGGAAESFRGASGQVTADGLREQSFQRAAPEFVASGVFSGIAFEPLTSAAGRARAEARLRRAIIELAPTGGFRRAGARASYAPVTRVFPDDASRRAVVGFDILSEPRRAQAARRATDTGTPQLTAPLTLARTREPGFSVYYALYKGGAIPRTLAARRSSVLGWYTGSVNSGGIARRLRAQLPPGTALRVIDVDDGGRLVLGSASPLADATSRTTKIAGRVWRVSVVPDEHASPLAALVVGVGGVLLALLVGLALLESRRREAAEQLARTLAERDRARQAVLVRAAESMEKTTDADDRLRRLAAALVPDLGDLVHVAEVTDAGGAGLHFVATVASDPEIERIAATQPVRADVAPVAEALRTGRPQRVGAPDAELLRAASVDEGHAIWRAELAIRDVLVVPLIARGRPLGVLFVVRLGADAREYDASELALAAELGAHAALALDNARSYELEHDIAQTLQRALLPPKLPDMRPLVAAARFHAAGEHVEIGGDIYDVMRTAENEWLVLIADVCGKGPRAAVLTTALRYAVRTLADGTPPAGLLDAVNTELAGQTRDDLFVTVALVRLTVASDGSVAHMLVAAGGHPAPLIKRRGGAVETVAAAGPLVGVDERATFTQVAVDLHRGDAILLFTDGVPEARRAGELFGEQRLLDSAGAAPGQTAATSGAEQLVDRVEHDVFAWTTGTPQDDVALLAIGLPDD